MPMTLDTNQANADLLAAYREAWPALTNATGAVPGASGPHLVMVPERWADSQIRVAVIGQQTETWPLMGTVDEQVNLYPSNGVVPGRRSPFWRAARYVTDALSGQEEASVLWTNLVAADVKESSLGRSLPRRPLRDALRAAVPPYGLLHLALDVTRPDAAVFFVGPDGRYTYELERQYPGVVAEAVDGYAVRTLSRLHHPALPAVSYRTYHPAYLQRSKQWAVVEALPTLIADRVGVTRA